MNNLQKENFVYGALVLVSSIMLFLLMMFLTGCSHPETVIKDRVITVVPEPIHDTVNTLQLDTVVLGTKIFEHDTVAIIKYFPKYKFMDYTIKPDTIKLRIQDTLKLVKYVEKKTESPFLSKIGLIAIGLIVGAGMILFIRR